jgi:ribosomal protein S18 acetylase RimI-like enzyme
VTETTVRRVGPQDGQLLRAVRLRALETDPASFGSTHEREAAFERADWDEWADEDAAGDSGATLVALRGLVPIGLVTGARDDDEAKLFHVYAMWVAPEARRDGVGRRLLAEIEMWMTSNGAAVSQLSVTSEADAARRLYESAGYEPDGEVEESPHTPGLLHVSLRKPLASGLT